MNRLVLGFSDKIPYLLTTLEDFPCTIIDPTGNFAEAAANITAHDDALYFDPSDAENPVGVNLLDLPPEDICSLFEAWWPQGWGAQSNWILANCLSVVPKADTILGVLKILKDKNYRTACIKHADPIVSVNWRIINGWDEKQFNAAVAPILNKVGTLLLDPVRRNILCQPYSTLTKSVVIANLNRSKIGDLTAKVLGYILMRRPGQVYIHDLGFFSSDYLASFLPQDRYTVTLQFLRQLTPKLQEAVLAIPEKIVFRTNRADAEDLMFYFGLGNASVLMDLDTEQAQTRDGTFNTEAPKSLRRLQAIRRLTRANNTRPRKQVERAIAKFLTLPPAHRE